MSLSILGGYLKAYNEDEKLAKAVEANALALGQKSISEQRSADRKRILDREDFVFQEGVKAGFKPRKDFTVDLGDNKNVVFPTYEHFGSNTGKDVVAIDNLLRNLDTEDKIKIFTKQAMDKGGYDSSVIELLKSYRGSKTQKWGPNNENEPIMPPTTVNAIHPFSGYFNNLKVKIMGVNEPQQRDKTTKSFIVPPPSLSDTNADPVYSITLPDLDNPVEGDEYLWTNQQVIHPASAYKDVYGGPEERHIWATENGTRKNLLQVSVADMFNRDYTTEFGKSMIQRDWNNFFSVPAVQKVVNGNGQITTQGEGLLVPLYVMGKDGKVTTQERYLPTGFNTLELNNNIYPAMNVAKFRAGTYQMVDDKAWNSHPSNRYQDLVAIEDAKDQAEEQIFMALDIFNGAADVGYDPMSSVGSLIKVVQDGFLAENSQIKQLFRGLDDLVGGTINAEWNDISEDNKKAILAAQEGINEYRNMDADGRSAFSSTANAKVLLDQIFTLLAYNIALTTQGGTSLSARVSNEDYDNARDSVVGGGFDSLENRMQSLMQYYQTNAPKSMSFYMLDSEQGWGITGKRRILQNSIIPIILETPLTEDIVSLGNYRNPYDVMNYLAIRPGADKKRVTWSKAVQFAYRNNPAKAFDPDYKPNASSSVIGAP